MNSNDFKDALNTIQMEYLEMPELRLTVAQARRPWTLPMELCGAALAALEAAGFLVRTRDGSHLRRGTPPVSVDRLDDLTWVARPI